MPPTDECEDLARREAAVIDRVGQATGLMEDKTRQLRETGVFDEAAAIHGAYVELAGPPRSNVEALKRAVFLGWNPDPACFTGLSELSEAAIRRGLQLLEDARAANAIDDEFAVMLGWYWFIAPWHFTQAAPHGLERYLARLETHAYERHSWERAALGSRGQMGMYWASVVTSAGRRRAPKPDRGPP